MAIKGEPAELTKRELPILWSDYIKAPHPVEYPGLHDVFWRAAKLCSFCQVELIVQHADELLEATRIIQERYWATKKRDVAWVLAGD